MVRADGNKANRVLIFTMENSTIIARYVYASIARIVVMKRVVVKNRIKLICKEEIPTPLKLFLQFERQFLIALLKLF